MAKVARRLTLIAVAGLLFALPASAEDDLEFEAELSGANEVPPVDSNARGSVELEVDEDRSKIDYSLNVRSAKRDPVGLLGAAGAHIHCAPEGANGPVVAFLAGVIAGGVDGRVKVKATLTDANIINPACGETIADLVEAMLDGDTYVNVHSLANPSGEVRGQIELDD